MKKLVAIVLSIMCFVACKKDEKIVHVKPKADFDVKVNKNIASITNKSIDGKKFIWDFGDGSKKRVGGKSDKFQYTYKKTGEYTITLLAENENGKNEKKIKITISEMAKGAEAKVSEAVNNTPTKLEIDYELINSDTTPTQFHLQLSTSEDFETLEDIAINRHEATKELELNPDGQNHVFKNLIPGTKYNYRVKISNSKGTAFSNIASARTLDVSNVGGMRINLVSQEHVEIIPIKQDLQDDCIMDGIEYGDLIAARDPEFKQLITLSPTHIFYTYHREPGATIYVKSEMTFKGQKHVYSKQFETPNHVIVRNTDDSYFTSNTTKAHAKFISLGDTNGEHIVINLPQGTNKTGSYPLKLNQTENPSEIYITYYDKDNVKYTMDGIDENATLEIYEVNKTAVYGRIKNYVRLKSSDNKKSVSFTPILFKAQR